MNKLLTTLGCAAAIGGFLLMFDAVSTLPESRRFPATIINVQDDPEWGYVGEDKRTLVQWEDGVRGYVPGALGEPGEVIPALRGVGTSSLFGWTGDRRRLFAEKED